MFGTGDRNYKAVKEEVDKLGIDSPDIDVVPYIDNMAEVMAASDVVIARSGAITVSEIAALGKPSILIPSPNVVRNHQEQNAREFEKNGAAEVITEDELTADKLYSKIVLMLEDTKKLDAMSENLLKMAKTDALLKIYELMKKMSDR